jgi:hypothetical protein
MKGVEIQTVIYCHGNRYRKPESAAKALARSSVDNLLGWGPDWGDDETQEDFDAKWDVYEAKADRIEAKAYRRFLKVCKEILA